MNVTNLTNIYSSSKINKNEVKSFDTVFNNVSNAYTIPDASHVTGTNPFLTAAVTGGMTIINCP